jgi:Fe-S cluster assembly scaffold protein SufB
MAEEKKNNYTFLGNFTEPKDCPNVLMSNTLQNDSHGNFKCRVPLKNTRQYFVVDGLLKESDSFVCSGNDVNCSNDKIAQCPGSANETESVQREFSVHTRLGKVSTKLSMPEHVREIEKGAPLNINLPEGKIVENLLQIIAIRTNPQKPELRYDINITAGKNSSGKVVLCSHTLAEEKFLTAENINIKVCEGATLDFLAMQNEHNLSSHVTHFTIEVCKDATFHLNLITLHGGEINNNIETYLTGEHANCELDGLYLADGKQKIKTEINLTHKAPKCNSLQLFKGILGGEAVSNFSGEILVAPDAQKTEAYQSNNNLLTTDTATGNFRTSSYHLCR